MQGAFYMPPFGIPALNQYDGHKSDYRSTMRAEKQFIVNISQRGNELYWIAEFPNNF